MRRWMSFHRTGSVAALFGLVCLLGLVVGPVGAEGPLTPVTDTSYVVGDSFIDDMLIVVVEMNGATVGMVADGVSEVLRVSQEAIEPPSPIVTTVDSAFIRGIAKVAERLVILLDLGKVLSVGERTALQAVLVG